MHGSHPATNEPVGVGDLAVVVKPGYHGQDAMGFVFKVKEIRSGDFVCRHCGLRHGETVSALMFDSNESDNGRRQWIRVSRLKRIPPLGELEGEKQKEDIREPA